MFPIQRSHTENRTIIVDIGKQVSAVDVTIDDGKHGTTDMVGNPLGVADDFRFANSLFQDLNDAVGNDVRVGRQRRVRPGWLAQPDSVRRSLRRSRFDVPRQCSRRSRLRPAAIASRW